jgi:hypothetical protein
VGRASKMDSLKRSENKQNKKLMKRKENAGSLGLCKYFNTVIKHVACENECSSHTQYVKITLERV